MGKEGHHQHHKSTFLPMLCSRPSIKGVSIPRLREHSESFGNEPFSPRISCMGQVKRNNKIAGIPSSHRLSFSSKSSTTTSPSVKYSKLKKLFSGKNFISTPKTTTTISSCGTRRPFVHQNQRCVRNENNTNLCINIENMDPPLPVIKRLPPKLEDTLWKRRSGTTAPALKTLQLQHIHHPRFCIQPPTA
ncbi:hypothetical protein VNO77_10386 [Canavalia gladiata]|uniref:Uncharacterized protein n=1 Tax=Canavalia gladiata TaxID=3824 RepID=A0AAN9MAU5_CANGL